MTHQCHDILAQVDALICSGDADDALRLSGDELARFDNRWRRAHNSCADAATIDSCLEDLSALAVCHSQLLMQAGIQADALMVPLLAITAMAMDDRCAQHPHDMMALCSVALLALDTLTASMNPDDDFARSHIEPMTRYIASMTYYWYAATRPDNPDITTPAMRDGQQSLAWHHEITPLLRTLIRAGMVSWPTINVCGHDETADHPQNIMGDLLGHCHALGLAGE